MNTCIFLVLKSTLNRWQIFKRALQIFKHVVGSLHISYTKYTKLFVKVFDQGNICHYLPGDTGGRGILKRVTNGDIGGRRV